jgi:competence protein ComEA
MMNKNQSTFGMGGIAATNGSGFQGLRKLVLAMGAALLVSMNPLAWAGEPVNINLASAEAIAEAIAEALGGVGLAKANRIVEYREAYGPFKHVAELAAVRGIGQATVEKNRDAILLR